MEELQKRKLPFLFVTNNTTKSPETVANRLADEFDIHVAPETVYTATLATIDFMKTFRFLITGFLRFDVTGPFFSSIYARLWFFFFFRR